MEIVARDGVTVFLGVPTTYAAQLRAELPAGFDAGRLRLAVSGGAAPPVEVVHGIERRFGATVLRSCAGFTP
ncbi:hypothetical protein ACWGJB_49635 [Streptomyces sp. NPDC054813]